MSRPEATRVRTEIEYAIIALHLPASEISKIIKDAIGLVVDPHGTEFLDALNPSQLEAIWEKLSQDARWKRAGSLRSEFI